MPKFYDLLFVVLNKVLPYKLCQKIIFSVDLEQNGNMFLHIFWALSAYVIFSKFFIKSPPNNTLLTNSVKRYFRLAIPCAVSIFFSYILYQAGLIYVKQMPDMQVQIYLVPPSFWHALSTAVWNTLFDFDFYKSYNGPLWTIQKEFYGSLFCFALFGIIGKLKNRGYIYLAIFICVMILKMYWLNSFLFGYYLCDYDFSVKHQHNVIFKIITKIDDFIVSHQLIGFIIYVVLVFVSKAILIKTIDLLNLVNCWLSFFTIFIVLRISAVATVMSWKFFTTLGKISFGLYVLHFPIICSFTSWYYLKYHVNSAGQLITLFVFTTVICMTSATIFYKYVDMNSVKWSNQLAARLAKIIS